MASKKKDLIVRLSVNLPQETVDRLREAAKRRGTSLNEVLRQVLEEKEKK